MRENDFGNRPTQRAALPKAFIDVRGGHLIRHREVRINSHEENGRDHGAVP
jgi:hypothetical protein